MSIGIGKESYENENDWLNDGDRAYGTIALALDDSLCYLICSAEYPKEIWTILDRTFGKHNEDHNSTLEITASTTRFLHSKVTELLSLMKLFKMKMKQNILHIQFELKKVSMK